jgi:hypothetical protein
MVVAGYRAPSSPGVTFVRASGTASSRAGSIGSPVSSSIPYVPSSIRPIAASISASSASSPSRIERSFSR